MLDLECTLSAIIKLEGDNIWKKQTAGREQFGNSFSINYDEVVRERQNNELKRDVEIKNIEVNLSIYSKIILISRGISPVMKKILKEYDLSGKEVFVASSNARRIGHSFKDCRDLLPNSNIKVVFSPNEGERDKMITTDAEILGWLAKIM